MMTIVFYLYVVMMVMIGLTNVSSLSTIPLGNTTTINATTNTTTTTTTTILP